MASLFRPKVVEYKSSTGAYRTTEGVRVTSKTPGAVRHETESPTWWGKWTDRDGVEHKKRLSEKKEIARRMLAKLSGDAQLAGAGIADRYAEHRLRSLADHLEDFARFLSGKGNTEQHVKLTASRCRAILEGCHAEQFEDLQPSAVVEFLAGLATSARALKEPPAGMEMLTRAELVDALGVNAGGLTRSSGGPACKVWATARRVSTRVPCTKRCGNASPAGRASSAAITT